MATDPLLRELADSSPDTLIARLTEIADSCLDWAEESAIECLKSELDLVLQERINALEDH